MDSMIKAILIGKEKAGKTQLSENFKNQPFSDKYSATFGVSFHSKPIELNGVEHNIALWDTSGKENYKSMIYSYLKGIKIVFFVFDLTSKESFDYAANSIPPIKSKGESIKVMYLLGNKSDLKDERTVSIEEAEKLAKDNGLHFSEISAKDPGSFMKVMEEALEHLLKEQNSSPIQNED